MPDRYRDVASKCDRYLPPPHYLASGAPLVSSSGNMANNVVDTNSVNMYGNVVNRGLVGNANNSIVTNSTDNYLSGYLSSTVHTPVKRYIPSTNTIATDIYSDSTVVLPHHQQVRVLIFFKLFKIHFQYFLLLNLFPRKNFFNWMFWSKIDFFKKLHVFKNQNFIKPNLFQTNPK